MLLHKKLFLFDRSCYLTRCIFVLFVSYYISIFSLYSIITGDDRNIISGKKDDLGTSFKLNITRKTTSLDKKKTETKCLFARKIKNLEYI